MIIIEEYKECDRNDIVLIKSQTYYKLEFLTNDWILRRLYISHRYMKEEILEKAKMTNLRKKKKT